MIQIPEATLFNLLKEMISFLKRDFEEKTNKSDSLLHNMLFGIKIGEFDYLEQAKDIFLREQDHPRGLDVRIFFDRERASVPTIHITLPSEESGAADGIGVDEGYNDPIVNETEKIITPVYNRSFNTTYNLIITSDNQMEVLIIYHVFRNLIISMFDTFEISGLRNPKLGGHDLQLNDQLVPAHIFIRAISLSFFYDVAVPRFFAEKLIKSINENITLKGINPIKEQAELQVQK